MGVVSGNPRWSWNINLVSDLASRKICCQVRLPGGPGQGTAGGESRFALQPRFYFNPLSDSPGTEAPGLLKLSSGRSRSFTSIGDQKLRPEE